MAARKLQSEVDRTLKRVTEGVEAFQDQYQKLQNSSNQTQKEKLEADLKQQIKRLQRMRDSIKTWLGSNEIKDKQPLTDARKLIETQMELFKACEKEMKTKAFSKEGLSAAVKLDPMDVLKGEMSDFISETVTELGRQIEVAEAEVESLQGGAKKKRGVPNERIAEVEALNERRRWHVSRLELILRLLENGQIPPPKVADIQTDVKYFLESNTEEDFVEDEGIYDDLDLEQTEEQFGLTQDDLQSSHDTSSVADTSEFAPHPPPQRTPAKEPVKPAVSKPNPASSADDAADRSPAPSTIKKPPSAPPVPVARKATLDGTTARPTAAQIKGVPAPVPTPRTVPPPMQPVRYSVAAASAVAPSTPAATAQSTPISAPAPAPVPATSAPALSSVPAAAPPASIVSPRGTEATLVSPAKPVANVPSATQSSASPAPSSVSGVSGPPPPPSAPSASGASPSSASVALPSPPASSMLPFAADPARPGSAALPDASPSPAPSASRMASNSLSDLLTTFESAKSKAQRGAHDLGAIHQVLHTGISTMPQPQDAERPRHYAPKVPYHTPDWYPQQPTTQLESPAMFAKLDIDTLFYIFYYQPGTYSQYLAAQELKAKSWRFHTSYLTWFQRAQEPDTITDEYEQGVYHYFDWESGWSSRRKTGFRFEYKALEAF